MNSNRTLGVIWIGSLLLSMVTMACAPSSSSGGSGASCTSDAQCTYCYGGKCLECMTAADCPSGSLCRANVCERDAGCTATSCPANSSCNGYDGVCHPNVAPARPVCGQADPSGGYDAGWGPAPSVSNSVCYSCAGCPKGSECLCGAAGLIGNVRCADLGSGAACLLTGGGGICRLFSGDCATNTQCAGLPGTPVCSEQGQCVQCLRDSDCPQDAGAQGCVNNQCGACCTSNAQCPASGPLCDHGFCYAQCASDSDCQALDAGTPFCCGALCQAGPVCQPDAGSDADVDAEAGSRADGGADADAGDADAARVGDADAGSPTDARSGG